MTTRVTLGSDAVLADVAAVNDFTVAKTVHPDVPDDDSLFPRQGKVVIYPRLLLPSSSRVGIFSDT